MPGLSIGRRLPGLMTIVFDGLIWVSPTLIIFLMVVLSESTLITIGLYLAMLLFGEMMVVGVIRPPARLVNPLDWRNGDMLDDLTIWLFRISTLLPSVKVPGLKFAIVVGRTSMFVRMGRLIELALDTLTLVNFCIVVPDPPAVLTIELTGSIVMWDIDPPIWMDCPLIGRLMRTTLLPGFGLEFIVLMIILRFWRGLDVDGCALMTTEPRVLGICWKLLDWLDCMVIVGLLVEGDGVVS